MALPRLSNDVNFTVTLPTDGRRLTMRPFTVREEKILLTARESKDREAILDSLLQVVTNCMGEGKAEDLSFPDFEWVLLQLRSQSVGGVMDLKVVDPDTKEEVKLKADIKDARCTEPVDGRIMLTETVGVKMRYPSIKVVRKGGKDSIAMLAACVESVWEGDDVQSAKDLQLSELTDWLLGLNSTQAGKLRDYLGAVKVVLPIRYERRDGTVVERELDDVWDFMQSA